MGTQVSCFHPNIVECITCKYVPVHRLCVDMRNVLFIHYECDHVYVIMCQHLYPCTTCFTHVYDISMSSPFICKCMWTTLNCLYMKKHILVHDIDTIL